MNCKKCNKEISQASYSLDKLCSSCRAKVTRKAKEQAYKDCGLVKVKGALGGTYWE